MQNILTKEAFEMNFEQNITDRLMREILLGYECCHELVFKLHTKI